MDLVSTGTQGADRSRREQVLVAALDTFVRYGYRKTSMEEVAGAAGISRPGLYLLFGSKQELFTAAVIHALERGASAVAAVLADTASPVRDRLLEAFDEWTGRYIGAMSREATAIAEEYSDLLGPAITEYPARFEALLDAALSESPTTAPRSEAIAQTLISTAIGIKHQVTTRAEFLERLATAVDLIVG